MEVIHYLETRLGLFVAGLTLLLEAIAAFCVLIGLLKTAQLAISLNRHHFRLNRRHARTFSFALLRLRFGVWLAVALECQLGADIVATTVAPSFEALGKLGAIAAIRTFLNHFLNKELAEELTIQHKIKHDASVRELTEDQRVMK